ncbi:MAG: YkgJ family cysteine cluster protein [Proteobacteria bacterium]|nr:YkgJ family cysteine cluster protein [Pseudomonadota bacterium]
MEELKEKSDYVSFIKSAQNKSDQTECKRCCTCCAKGGPALHKEDLDLIQSGKLHGRFLFTIREGEPAKDNVKGGLAQADTDIIKIKSKDGTDACLYANFTNNQCSIYEDRPIECKTLKCWDTAEIEALYNKNRLTRKDIIGGIQGLWELVEEHQQKCSFSKVKQIIEEAKGKIEGQALKQLLEIVQYDISIRTLVLEKTDTDPNLIPFLFGTPMQSILRKLGIEFKQRS